MIWAALRAVPVMVALAGVGGDGLMPERADGTLHPQWTEVQWTEIQWPFPIDQWGTGRAFRCEATVCGATVTLYLRPKIGFCNCGRGVYNDAELDRIADLTLLGPQFSGLAEGRIVTVGWMTGRSRLFAVRGSDRKATTAATIAFNDKCDVVVATVIADADLPRGAGQALQFLNSDPVLRWAEAELGSNGS